MKPVTSHAFAVACLAVALLVPDANHAQAKRAITYITDPIHAEAATRLEAEISKRFNRPISI